LTFQARFIILFDLTLKQKCVKQYKKKTQIQSWNAYETLNKSNKIWLKRLNPRILKYEGLNWFKVLKWTNFKIY